MTIGGWLFMIGSLAFVWGLAGWCFVRILRGPNASETPQASNGSSGPGAMILVLLVGLVSGATPASSQVTARDSNQAVASDQGVPGPLQFDFMIGEWDVVYRSFDVETGELKQELKAVQKARYVNNRSMIVDEWASYDPDTGDQVTYGLTLRSYAEETGKWYHNYLRAGDPTGGSRFNGEWRDGVMHAEGAALIPGGRTLRFRLKFYEIEADSFKWMEEWSIDDGATWHLAKTQDVKRR